MGKRRAIIGVLCLVCLAVASVVGAAKMRRIQTNFTAGEFSPFMLGRVDFAKYVNATETLENMVVYPHGPAVKRPGFRYVADAKYPGFPVRLIPFQYSTDQAYMLEFGHKYMRAFYNNGQAVTTGSSEYVPNPDFNNGTSGWTDRPATWVHKAFWAPGAGVTDAAVGVTLMGCGAGALVDYGTHTVLSKQSDQKASYEIGFDVKVDTPTTLAGSTVYVIDASLSSVANSSLVNTSPAQWTVSGATVATSTTGYVGTSPKISLGATTGASAYVINNTYTIEATTYEVQGWVYFEDEDATEVTMNVEPTIGTTLYAQRKFVGFPSREWVKFSVQFPKQYDEDATNSIKMRFMSNLTSGVTHFFYLDNLYVIRKNAPDLGSDLLPNAEGSVVATIPLVSGTSAAWTRYTSTFMSGVSSSSLVVAFGWKKTAIGVTAQVLYDNLSIKRTDLPYEIETPFEYFDVEDLQYTQSADVMILTHQDHAVRQLSRTALSPLTFTLTTFAMGAMDAAFAPLNSGTTSYPACCLFHENRLVFARTVANPIDVWISTDGDFTDFITAAVDTDPINISIASDEVNRIQWLRSMGSIMVGTSGGEWRVGPADETEALTTTNITAKRQTIIGSYDRTPVQIGNTILFIQYLQQKLYKLSYNWESAGYVAPELSILSNHVPKPGLNEMAFQRQPHAVVWGVRSDGTLVGMTYHEEHEVVSWHRHPSSYGLVKNIGVIPGTVEDQVWAAWKRERSIEESGVTNTTRTIEYLETFYDSEDLATAYFVDSAFTVTFSSSSASGISAPYLGHLAGKSVKVLIDGTTVENCEVDSSGGLTTTATASRSITVGYPYTAKLKTLRPEMATQQGTIQGVPKSLTNVALRLYRSWGGQMGETFSNLRSLVYKPPGSSAALSGATCYTGDLHPTALQGGANRDGQIAIQHSEPYPFTLLAIMFDMEVE